jgi:Lon protease-like protein
LLTDCLNGDRQFGVVCRPESVAESDIMPGTVGCIAKIESTRELPDGRSHIVVTGTERFQLERFVADAAPYYVAEVTTIADRDEPADVLEPLAGELRTLFDRIGKSARTIADDASPVPDLPQEPAHVSFAVAQYIDLELEMKQRLLSSLSPSERLRELTELLERIAPSVEQRAVVHTRARGNGQGPHVEAG